MDSPLGGLRVVELADEIAGPYCGKLLADLGASVVKIEVPDGDPLRSYGPFPDGIPDRDRSGLFHYLNSNKRILRFDPEDAASRHAARELIAEADVVVEGHAPGALDDIDPSGDALRAVRNDLVVVRISSFGQTGPSRNVVATGFTLQAASGWVTTRDLGRAPVQAGARMTEYVGGAYAALGALTALRQPDEQGPIEVDVSLLECNISTLPYPMVTYERLRRMGLPPSTRAGPMLGIVRCRDGWIGINCLTGQHWLDCCALLGLPEFGEKQIEIMLGGPERPVFFEAAQPWLDQHGADEILELAQAMRIPAAPVGDGRTMVDFPQYRERGFFVANGSDSLTFTQPGPPYRLSRTPAVLARTAPDPVESARARRSSKSRVAASDRELPFEGLRVLDLTTFLSGAYLTCYLGAFGADVVKVESVQRPDGFRYQGVFPSLGDDWFEQGGMFQAANLNKRDITLDLARDEGRRLVRRLIGQADVVVENFSPRVVEHFGLDYGALRNIKPDVIQVRMPGFGLEGPWKNFVGWALGFEQTAGAAAVTGYSDGPPLNLQGPADPIVGIHAGIALLSALEHRRRTGEGQLIEVAQIEVIANLTAESVIEYSMNGAVSARRGNRQRDIVQGLYPTKDDGWAALTIRDDRDWNAFIRVLEDVPELRDERFRSPEARIAAHDELDERIGAWTRLRAADEVTAVLRAAGVPVAPLLTVDRMYDDPQLVARGYYVEMPHPISGTSRYPGWPIRFSPGPSSRHRMPAPLLGQHNQEILADRLGLSETEIDGLRARDVIGDRPRNL